MHTVTACVREFKAEAETLYTELTYHLRDRRMQNPDNQRLLSELGWHHDRPADRADE